MKITQIRYYDGARDKIGRLGLASLFLELLQILLETKILLKEEKDGNGAAVVRDAIDKAFIAATGWDNKKSGDVDWVKRQDTIRQLFLGLELNFKYPRGAILLCGI